MAYRVIPCDTTKDYNFRGAYHDHKVIDWHRPPNLKKGDIVYIYFTHPIKAVCVKCEVIISVVPKDQVIRDDKYWITPIPPLFYDTNTFSRLKILNILDNDKGIKLKELVAANIGFSKYSIQGSGKTLNQIQVEYLEKRFNGLVDNLTEINESQIKEYHEGAIVQKWVEAYERDQEARQACLNHYGVRCQVCKKDFIKEYGVMGEGCIEVHHLVPISKNRKEHKVDPINDLIPVCPNCHTLIHSAMNKGYDVSTLEKIKKVLFK